MCVEHDSFVPTEDLILSKPRRHFCTTVHAIHWQLRSLIGVEGQNVVYYVTGDSNKNIQRLDTRTKETETIRRLPFSPRCLVAENGWICCGGEKGEFSAIRLVEEGLQNGFELQSGLLDPRSSFFSMSELAPIDINSLRPEDALFVSLARARSDKNILVDSKKFGRDLVNCITLWFPPTLAPPAAGSYSEPMAVISNNDKTVTLIKLEDQEMEEVLTFPDSVNRAVMSPDGRLLIAITDDPYLYIHERVEKPSSGPFRIAERASYGWTSAGKIHLRTQNHNDPTYVRGSFAACFSSNGRYLAVGTQSASISIFNVAGLTVPGVDPLLTSFASSRSSTDRGAVRDMAFAPGQSDLLAWTEDRGRVGVVDLRKGYVSRQIIALDEPEDYEHITTNDRSTIDPRLLEQRANDNLSSTFASTLDLSLDAQSNLRPETRESLARYYSPLTSEETLVLEALQDRRRRQEQREQRVTRAPRAVNASGSSSPRPWAERSTRAGATSDAVTTRNREPGASVSRVVNDLMSSIRDQRERLRDQGRQAHEHGGRPRGTAPEDSTDTADWRRALIPSPPGAGPQGAATATASIPVSERRALRLAIELGSGTVTSSNATTSNLRTALDGAEERLSNIRNAMTQLSQAGGGNSQSNAESTGTSAPASAYDSYREERYRPSADADFRRRERTAYLMREWEDTPQRRIDRFLARNSVGVEHSTPDPHDTSGLAWSEDGRMLFIGADNGIYELHVNHPARMMFPSVTRR